MHLTQFFHSDGTLAKKVDVSRTTVFNTLVTTTGLTEAHNIPGDFINVKFLGHDSSYGDTFMAWDDPNNFYLFFGKKGIEFNDHKN